MPAAGSRRRTHRHEEDIEEATATQADDREDIEPTRVKTEKVRAGRVKAEKSRAEKNSAPANVDEDDEDEGDGLVDDERIDVNALGDQPLGHEELTKLQMLMTSWEKVHKTTGSTYKAIHELVPHIIDFNEGDDKAKGLKTVDKLIRDLMDFEAEMLVHKDILNSSYQNVAQQVEVDNVGEVYNKGVDDAMEIYQNKTTRQKYGAADSQYANFKNAVFEIQNPGAGLPPISKLIPKEEGDASDDEEFEMGGVAADYKCQLSMKDLLDPMTTPCDHHFDAESLKMYLKGTRGKCPATGCDSRYTIGECKADKDLSKKVKAWKRRQERARATQQEEMVID
ncbi:hypothetical protein DL96DRAFT_1611435 [Flagelloscypha sp. PMI_526]|nr:hypothetical protein DL96DRAFT_1611435 [Flagelloscypha sp. PMI_526]